jgi:hypothetical protein
MSLHQSRTITTPGAIVGNDESCELLGMDRYVSGFSGLRCLGHIRPGRDPTLTGHRLEGIAGSSGVSRPPGREAGMDRGSTGSGDRHHRGGKRA